MANGSFYETRNRYSKIYVLAMISLKVMNVRVERLKYRAITRDIHLNNPFSSIGIPRISDTFSCQISLTKFYIIFDK